MTEPQTSEADVADLTYDEVQQFRDFANMLEAVFDAGWQPNPHTRSFLRAAMQNLEEGFKIVKKKEPGDSDVTRNPKPDQEDMLRRWGTL